jgi:hypothetical protein
MSELPGLYTKMEVLLEEFRVEWERTNHEHSRRENYWQGKKDGLRIAMNLICPLVNQELTDEE